MQNSECRIRNTLREGQARRNQTADRMVIAAIWDNRINLRLAIELR